MEGPVRKAHEADEEGHLVRRVQSLPDLFRQGLRRLCVQGDPLRLPLEGGQGGPVAQVGVEEAALAGAS